MRLRVVAVLVGLAAVAALVPGISNAFTVAHRRRGPVEAILAARSDARRACLSTALLQVPAHSSVVFAPDPDAILTKLSAPRLLSVSFATSDSWSVGLVTAGVPGVHCGTETVTITPPVHP